MKVPQIPLANVPRVPATSGFLFCPSPRMVKAKAQNATKAPVAVQAAVVDGVDYKIKILDDSMYLDYEPTDAEVEEYANWLGMDLPSEQHLLWIAREALKAPCPQPWKPCETEDGEIFFFNFKTGESVWDHPCDVHYKKLHQEHKTKKTTPGPVPTLCLAAAQAGAGATDLFRSPRKLTARVKQGTGATVEVAGGADPAKKSKVTVLEEEPPDSEPAQELVEEYAIWLGMSIETDRDLFWIARAGLKQPCPENWKPCMTDEGDVFYFNFKTGESIWDHPCDPQYKVMYQEHKAKR